jgi:hypothetical protein
VFLFTQHTSYVIYQLVAEIYPVSSTLTFILTEDKVLVRTPHQDNLVIHASGNYKKKLKILREKIRKNEIQTISELLDFNKTRIGGTSQMQGLILVSTQLERHVCITS